ncbi:MAG: cell surface protein SprA [Candidatus Marinimicrobia bacterium]|nr:cell surface protein SprA [Candidatus Neomarinimicrobiota bacterium]
MIEVRKRFFGVLFGLITTSILWAQASSPDTTIHFTYTWMSPHIMPLIYSEPKGFDRIKPQPELPLRYAYPITLSGLQIVRTVGWNKNILVQYEIKNDVIIRQPVVTTFDRYFEEMKKVKIQDLWYKHVSSKFDIREEIPQETSLEIIGADIAGQRVSLRVSGNISISGKLSQRDQSNQITSYQQTKTTSFIMDQEQNFTIEGRVGDRVSIKVDQDSQRDFNFENTLRINYTGQEDEIIQQIDAGNISLSLPGTNFVKGQANASGLYGIKALLKFGPLDVTTIASVEEGQNKKVKWGGGSESEPVIIQDYEYVRRKYYFVSDVYRKNMYPLDDQARFIIRRRITNFELYKQVQPQEEGAFIATAWVNPQDTTMYSEWAERNFYFKRLEEGGDYILDENLGYFKMLTSVNVGDVLAIAYRDTTLIPGDPYPAIVEGDLVIAGEYPKNLKLIKPVNPRPQHPTWDLEFKNVYYLGTRKIEEEGFDLKIYYDGGNASQERYADGTPYIRMFGLDRQDGNGVFGQYDDKVDLNANFLNLTEGELLIPYIRPFTSEKAACPSDPDCFDGKYNPNLPADFSSSALYDTTTNNNAHAIEHKFYIEVTYSNRSEVIELKDFMIIEGSEEITANQVKLVRGIDYEIDYFTGKIVLKSDIARNPNAELDISYNSRQVFQLDKKVIAGTRAEYRFGEKRENFIGGTFMYFNKSSIDEQVRVGEEPYRNFIWDINVEYRKNLDWLTRSINKLPLINTSGESYVHLSGEIAQIIPNPNTISNSATGDKHGVANIDDFEGSKRVTSLGVERRGWYMASLPVNDFFYIQYPNNGFLFWYNPYNDIPTNSIWPNREVSATKQNDVTRVLTMVLDPYIENVTGDSLLTSQTSWVPENSWGGIMKALYSGAFDQSQSKYIEIWVKGTKGVLRIDLGKISEDLKITPNPTTSRPYQNGKLDTEDKPEAGFVVGNGIIDEGENIGLNGLTDEEEAMIGWDPMIDNYRFEPGKEEYRYINGTERNEDESGHIPDTEDINNNGRLDVTNDYFTYELNLEDQGSPYFVTETHFTNIPGSPKTGWRLYRIPLSDPTEVVNNPMLTEIEFVRLVYAGVSSQDTLQIASIGLVGNEWQEKGIAAIMDSTTFKKDDDIFSIAVVNTDDNTEYYSPEGVAGKLDRIYNIRSKEQALTLKHQNLPPNHMTAARKQLYQSENYILYNRIKMFVHGDDSKPANEKQVDFYLRMGRTTSEADFYEIITPVYAGWDERNTIDVDFQTLTQLKLLTPATIPDSLTYRISADGQIKEFYELDENGTPTGRIYRVSGDPSLARIDQFTIGVINNSSNYYTGDIWINELRVSEPKREKGLAMRGSATLNVGSVSTLRINSSFQEAEFHEVDQKNPFEKGTQNLSDTRRFDMSYTLNTHEFLPKKWNVRIPVTLSFSESEDIPKYSPGSDIILTDVPDSLLAQSVRKTLQTSFNKNSTSDFFLTRWTLDRTSLGLTITDNFKKDRLTEENSAQTYLGNISYDAQFPKGKGVPYLSWVPLMGDRFKDNRFYWKPSLLKYSITSTENISKNKPWSGEVVPNHTWTMKRQFNLNYNPTDKIALKYSRTADANYCDYLANKMDALKELSLGKVTNITEGLNATFSPEFTSWLKPSFTYASSYSQNQPLYLGYANVANTRTISGSLNLNLRTIFSQNKKSASTSPSPPRQSQETRRPPEKSTNDKKDQKQEEEKTKDFSPKTLFNGFINNLSPITIRASETRKINHNGVVLGDSTAFKMSNWTYRYGFSETPGDSIAKDKVGENFRGLNINRTFNVQSGYQLTKRISTTLDFGLSSTLNEAGVNLTETFTRSYLPMGDDGRSGIPLPGWSVRWTGLNTIKFLSKYTTNVTLEHNYSGKEMIQYQNHEEKSSSYSHEYQPLIGLTVAMKNGIRSTARWSRSLDVRNTQADTKRTFTDNASLTVNYSHKGGLSIPLPFMDKVNLENTMDISTTFTYSNQTTHQRRGDIEKFALMDRRQSWVIQPEFSYQFSRNINGSAWFMYSETTSKMPTRISRDFGIKVNIRIRG